MRTHTQLCVYLDIYVLICTHINMKIDMSMSDIPLPCFSHLLSSRNPCPALLFSSFVPMALTDIRDGTGQHFRFPLTLDMKHWQPEIRIRRRPLALKCVNLRFSQSKLSWMLNAFAESYGDVVRLEMQNAVNDKLADTIRKISDTYNSFTGTGAGAGGGSPSTSTASSLFQHAQGAVSQYVSPMMQTVKESASHLKNKAIEALQSTSTTTASSLSKPGPVPQEGYGTFSTATIATSVVQEAQAPVVTVVVGGAGGGGGGGISVAHVIDLASKAAPVAAPVAVVKEVEGGMRFCMAYRVD